MGVVFTHELRSRGVGANGVRRMLRDDELFRLRRGAFSTTTPADAIQRHRQLITSTLPMVSPQSILSHVSAGVTHGLPVGREELERVTVTRPGKGGGRVTPYLHQYRTPLPASDIEDCTEGRRTSLARTVIDLARSASDMGVAVAAADVALRLGATRDELEAQLRAAVRRRGLAQARTAVELANARSESVGESVSRVAIWWLGLPPPVLQYEVRVAGATYRADFAWPEQRVLGEFDGKIKYDELVRTDDTAAAVIMREKRRDADLVSAGWRVLHWTFDDVRQPNRLGRLLRPWLLPT